MDVQNPAVRIELVENAIYLTGTQILSTCLTGECI